jgi:hypothetical protein
MSSRSTSIRAAAVVAVLVAAGTAEAADRSAEARALLQAFVRPGADAVALSQQLRPAKADYDAVFLPDASARLQSAYDPAWSSGSLVLKGKPGQTSVLVWSATAEDIKAWRPAARDRFPGGYQKVAPHLRPGVTLYSFKFVEPGETLGMAFDGLAYVNGRWRIFPKPFRVLQ